MMTQERVGRLELFADSLRRRGIDAAIVDSAESLRYLFGYSASAVMYQCCVVTADGSVRAVVRELDAPVFEAASWVEHRVTYTDWEDPFEVLLSVLHELGVVDAVIAQELDSNYLTVRDYQRIVAALPDARFVDIGGVVLEMRAQKSAAEIEEHRRAAAIADLGVAAVVDALAEGASERDLVAAGYAAALRAGADNNAPRIVLLGMGSKSEHFHGGVGDHRLEPGEPVHVELLPQVDGYSSRIMRPAVLGAVPESTQSVVDALVRIQDRQFAAIRPGAAAKEIDRIGRAGLAAEGLRGDFPNNTGYGVGIITGPRLADFARLLTPRAEWALLPGMVFHMYLSAAGLSISETVCVTDDGVEILTGSPRSIQRRDRER